MSFEITVGTESDLDKFKATLNGWDRSTVTSCWAKAKRRNELLILFGMAGGFTGVAIVPPKGFSLENHTVQNKYKHPFFLGTHIKRDALYVFGTELAVKDLLKEGAKDEQETSGTGDDRSTKPSPGARKRGRGTKNKPQPVAK